MCYHIYRVFKVEKIKENQFGHGRRRHRLDIGEQTFPHPRSDFFIEILSPNQGWAKWKTHDTHDILRNEISIVSLDKTHSAELYRKYRKENAETAKLCAKYRKLYRNALSI